MTQCKSDESRACARAERERIRRTATRSGKARRMKNTVKCFAGIILSCQTGCGLIVFDNNPLGNTRKLRAITSNGEMELADGSRVRLAGIRMRDLSEDDRRRLDKLPRDVNGEVEIHTDGRTKTAAAFYRAPIYYCGLACLVPIPRIAPKYDRACLNQRLIVEGFARFDPSCGHLPVEIANQCRETQAFYDDRAARYGSQDTTTIRQRAAEPTKRPAQVPGGPTYKTP